MSGKSAARGATLVILNEFESQKGLMLCKIWVVILLVKTNIFHLQVREVKDR